MGSIWRLIHFACAALVLGAATTARAQPAEPSAQVCRLGSYLQSVHDVDTRNHSFQAAFWVWTVCPSAAVKPLETMTFANAREVTVQYAAETATAEGVRSLRRYSGVFSQQFDLRDFPFDRHPLVIKLEDPAHAVETLRFAADTAGSAAAGDLRQGGWRLNAFKVLTGQTTHPAAFGLAGAANARFPSATLLIRAERSHWGSFIKLTAALYTATALTLVSFFLYPGNASVVSPRIGILGGALFAVVISMRASSDALGTVDGWTLLDEIHVSTLALILGATVTAVISRRMVEREVDARAVHRFDALAFFVFAALFVACNAELIWSAVHSASQDPLLTAHWTKGLFGLGGWR